MSVFLQDLIYLTIQEYKDSSTSELITKTDDEIQIMIWKAEDKIKTKIVYTLPELIVDVDVEIKKATVLVTDCLYKVEIQAISTWKELIEEKDENHTRKYQITWEVISTSEECMSGDVANILKPYLKYTGARFYRT